MLKINFIIHYFLKTLHFKESCNLIGWQHFGTYPENQNFARYRIVGEISITLVFILDYFYFREKLMTKFKKKKKKTLFWGHFFPFLLKFGQK